MLRELALRIRNVGYLLEAEIHDRFKGTTFGEMGHDERKCPVRKVVTAAEVASLLKLDPALFSGPDSGMRYWASQACCWRAEGVKNGRHRLVKALADTSPSVREGVVEPMGRFEGSERLQAARHTLIELADVRKHGSHVATAAWNAIDYLGSKASLPRIRPHRGTPALELAGSRTVIPML